MIGPADSPTRSGPRRHASRGKNREEEDSVFAFVRLVHQVLHLNLLPAGLIASMPHASCILLTESGRDIAFTATPGGSDFVSEARRQGEESQDKDEKAGQTDHEK